MVVFAFLHFRKVGGEVEKNYFSGLNLYCGCNCVQSSLPCVVSVDFGTRSKRLAKREARLPDETHAAKAARNRQSC